MALTPEQIGEESKLWQLSSRAEADVFADWLEENGEPDYAWSLRGLARLWEKEPKKWNTPRGFVDCMRRYTKDGWLEWVARWRSSKDFE